MLITTSSSSLQLFSFFDVLPAVLTTTGMTFMLLMFHILLISLFSSWYLSIFSLSFLLTFMSSGKAISIMTQLLSFLFTTAISGFLALISLSDWTITSHKIFTSSFSATISGECSYHFSLFFRLYFPHNFQWTILATLLLQLFVLSIVLLFTLGHNMRYCFTLPSSNSVWIPSYSLYRYILLFLQLSHNQWLNWIPDIPSQVVLFHLYNMEIYMHPLQLINTLPLISLLK